MKRSYLISYLVLALLMFQSCKEKQTEMMVIAIKQQETQNAYGTYLTQDHQGNAVLCWTEKDQKQIHFTG